MIIPSVGRIVWAYPSREIALAENLEPCAALVTAVHTDRLVNLCVFDQNGNTHALTGVTLFQPGDEYPTDGPYCEWMPYQLGQAERHAEPEVIGTLTEIDEPIMDAEWTPADRQVVSPPSDLVP